MTTSPATSRVNSRVNKLRWSLYNCYDVELCNLQYLLGIETIFTKTLSEFGWVFANPFRFKLSGFSKLQQNLKNYKHFLFSAVSVYVAL